ncbi:MAG TPA: ferritin-like domain-containing protein [Thermoanaerobaculia bacterium]|nr:ferritin-like domain-containing protein [Thermoanaerobaculia bacterium]
MGDRQPVTSRPIRTKPQLIRALREAAEIEQQLMVQYLYAGFSLKKRPDERCNAAQFEYVRRWGSTLLMVARQEMGAPGARQRHPDRPRRRPLVQPREHPPPVPLLPGGEPGRREGEERRGRAL